VLVNEINKAEQQQITEVQLADFGSTVSQTCGHATDGDDIGTAIFRSPEAQLQLPWTTATDIWSFGIMVCCRNKRTSSAFTDNFSRRSLTPSMAKAFMS